MMGDTDRAAKMLKESGYSGQKVVVINPTDFPQIHPLGLVTADMLKRIGMNVDLQETDWGSVVQRRSSMQPVDKGGWSVFHTFSSAVALSTPATHPLLSGARQEGLVRLVVERRGDGAHRQMAERARCRRADGGRPKRCRMSR